MSAMQSQNIKHTNQSSEQDSSEKWACEISCLDSRIQSARMCEQDSQDYKHDTKK